MIMIGACVLLLVGLLIVILFMGNKKQLNAIKATTVGDKQHGSSRFLTLQEMRKEYRVVKLPNKMIDMSKEWKAGRIVHYEQTTKELFIDESRTHARVFAPTNVGKTSKYVIPNLQYNAMAGANIVIPDMKLEIYNLFAPSLEKLGYQVFNLNFTDVVASMGWELMETINKHMNHYLKTKNPYSKAAAESNAKKLAEYLSSSKSEGGNKDENLFYKHAAIAANTVGILLVSQFATDHEKHLASVRALIQNISAMPAIQGKSKMQTLLNDLPDDFSAVKMAGAAYAATDPETEGNIFSSALGDLDVFNDSLAEQVTCCYEKEMFKFEKLLNGKTAVFISLGEHQTNFYIFVKLFIQQLYDALMDYCVTRKGEKVLDHVIKFIGDEMGVFPKVNNLHNMTATCRNKGLLFDFIYQDPIQFEEIYGEKISKIISHQCETTIVLGLAKDDYETADKLSKICGNRTVRSGSVNDSSSTSNGKTTKSTSLTSSMMGRPLLYPDEILTLPPDTMLLFKRNKHVFMNKLYGYYTKEWGLQLLASEEKREYEEDTPVFSRIYIMPFSKVIEGLNDIRQDCLDDQSIFIPEELLFDQKNIDTFFYDLSTTKDDPKISALYATKKYAVLTQYLYELHCKNILTGKEFKESTDLLDQLEY